MLDSRTNECIDRRHVVRATCVLLHGNAVVQLMVVTQREAHAAREYIKLQSSKYDDLILQFCWPLLPSQLGLLWESRILLSHKRLSVLLVSHLPPP
jgi:hypothetical protein